MTDENKRKLLEIARRAVEAAVGGQKPEALKIDEPELNEQCGAFVTLKSKSHLRGCIGQFTAEEPLYITVQRMARSAATEDPRFYNQPIKPDDVKDIDIEISVLSPLKLIENPLDFELGVHGIYIKRGFQRGCFLPQVATETGWSKEEFLTHCAAGKAGLSADAWKDGDTEIYIFSAEILEEA